MAFIGTFFLKKCLKKNEGKKSELFFSLKHKTSSKEYFSHSSLDSWESGHVRVFFFGLTLLGRGCSPHSAPLLWTLPCNISDFRPSSAASEAACRPQNRQFGEKLWDDPPTELQSICIITINFVPQVDLTN